VRQLLEQGGMYGLEKPIGDMKFVTDTRYLAAMNTPGGGKNDVPNRLKRQFGIFNVPLPSVATINGIFGRLVEGRFAAAAFSDEVVNVASRLVPITISLWNRTQAKMLPTPAKFHYMFNIRELSKVFQGVILASRDRCVRGPRLGSGGICWRAPGSPASAVTHAALAVWIQPPSPCLHQHRHKFCAPNPELRSPRFNKSAAVGNYGGNVISPEGYLLALWLHECRCGWQGHKGAGCGWGGQWRARPGTGLQLGAVFALLLGGFEPPGAILCAF
jgi:hypothetical protein